MNSLNAETATKRVRDKLKKVNGKYTPRTALWDYKKICEPHMKSDPRKQKNITNRIKNIYW